MIVLYWIVPVMSVAAYLLIGGQFAKYTSTRAMQMSYKNSNRDKGVAAAMSRSDGSITAVATILFWPFVTPVVVGAYGAARTRWRHDPFEKDKRLREKDEKIRKMERELGFAADGVVIQSEIRKMERELGFAADGVVIQSETDTSTM